jgi:hypothetical protein
MRVSPGVVTVADVQGRAAAAVVGLEALEGLRRARPSPLHRRAGTPPPHLARPRCVGGTPPSSPSLCPPFILSFPLSPLSPLLPSVPPLFPPLSSTSLCPPSVPPLSPLLPNVTPHSSVFRLGISAPRHVVASLHIPPPPHPPTPSLSLRLRISPLPHVYACIRQCMRGALPHTARRAHTARASRRRTPSAHAACRGPP